MTVATPVIPAATRLPPLQNGDRMDRAEFERRWDATPGLKRAELIDGLVHMPPPVSHAEHSRPNSKLITWLGVYSAATPGTDIGTNGSVRLDLDNMPQPDAFLMISSSHGGQARLSTDDYIEGAPELVCEVSASTVSFDLHKKLNVYHRHGVREYIVWRTYDHALDYFILQNGEFVRLEPALGQTDVYQSRIFPGLWLDASALLLGDLKTVLTVLQQGLSSPEHAAFVAKLQSIGSSK